MSILLKILIVISLSGFKFLIAIPLSAYQYDFNFIQTLIFSIVGGVIGIFLFSALSNKINKLFPKKNKVKRTKKRGIKEAITIKTARKYGVYGIAAITPILLSIPIGTLIALRFFPEKKKTIPILMSSVVIWSLILSIILTSCN
jgi:uncharacterized protein involved in cysteine biosynthesis